MENRLRTHRCGCIQAILLLNRPCELQALISIRLRAICHAGAYQMLSVILAVDYEQCNDDDD